MAYITQIAVGVCTSLLTAALLAVWRGQQKLRQELRQREQALTGGMRCVLRLELIHEHARYMDKGYIPVYAMQNVLDSYAAYHALGGNGTITKMVDELKQLPTKNEEQLY